MTIIKLLDSLRATGRNDWIAFINHNHELDDIGRNISAVANGALRNNREHGYIVWGVDPDLMSVIGSNFHPQQLTDYGTTCQEYLQLNTNNLVAVEYHSFIYYERPVVLAQVTPLSQRQLPLQDISNLDDKVNSLLVPFKDNFYVYKDNANHLLLNKPEELIAIKRSITEQHWQLQPIGEPLTIAQLLETIDYTSVVTLLTARNNSSADEQDSNTKHQDANVNKNIDTLDNGNKDNSTQDKSNQSDNKSLADQQNSPNKPTSIDVKDILVALHQYHLIVPVANNKVQLTTSGALLLAHDLTIYPELANSYINIEIYSGNQSNSLQTIEKVKPGFIASLPYILTKIQELTQSSLETLVLLTTKDTNEQTLIGAEQEEYEQLLPLAQAQTYLNRLQQAGYSVQEIANLVEQGSNPFANESQPLTAQHLATLKELPYNLQVVEQRRPAYSLTAIQEALVNLFVHNDYADSAINPTIRIFTDRLEFYNNTKKVANNQVERLVDALPMWRNVILRNYCRDLNLCQGIGNGFADLVYDSIEWSNIAPHVEILKDKVFKLTLSMRRDFEQMTVNQRIYTAYWFACVKYYVDECNLVSQDLRLAFRLSDTKDKYKASRVLGNAVNSQLLKKSTQNGAHREMSYVPWWADRFKHSGGIPDINIHDKDSAGLNSNFSNLVFNGINTSSDKGEQATINKSTDEILEQLLTKTGVTREELEQTAESKMKRKRKSRAKITKEQLYTRLREQNIL